MEIKVDPEEINKYVAQKLIESSIGTQLKKIIDSNVQNICAGYNNPIEPVVKTHINEAVSQIINEEFQDRIKEIVRKQLTDEFVTGLIGKLWERFIRNY